MDAPVELPHGARARAYAGVELLLEVLYIGNERISLDLESMLICYTVVEATMRPLIGASKEHPHLLGLGSPPEEFRGSISRLAIADRTGLARETVRRKVLHLIEQGFLYEDKDGRLRNVATLATPGAQKAANDVFMAVQRYCARLRELGAHGPEDQA